MASITQCLLPVLVVLQLCGQSMANVEQLVQSFQAAIDVLAPPQKAAKLKADMEEARPCLDTLVSKIGDATMDQVLKGMVPLAMKCGTELMKAGKDKEEKKKVFMDCVQLTSGDFLDGLPDNEKNAFMEAKNCLKAIFADLE